MLIVGCGDIGIPLAAALAGLGAEVWGLRRRVARLPAFIHPLAADVTDPRSLSVLADLEFDYVVLTLTPAAFSPRGYAAVFEQGVAHLLEALGEQKRLRRLLHVSSTSVYHQRHGEWVDEHSPTQPDTFSGRSLLRAEQLLASAAAPLTVVRFAGIYGPGRRRLIEQVRSGQGCPQLPVLYTNRIHRDDCVGFLLHLLRRDDAGDGCEALYLGVDSEPASMWDVKYWLAQQLGVELNPETAATPNRRSSKRCSNQRMLNSGYQLLYPDFRRGYHSVLKPA